VTIFERLRGRNESSFVGEKDLFEVQDCAPCRRGEGDLREPEAQAAAGMSAETREPKFGPRNLKSHSDAGRLGEFRVSVLD
jgi:hypothetical protein